MCAVPSLRVPRIAPALTIRELHDQLEQTTFPERLLLAGNATFPVLQVKHTICLACGLRIESEGVVLAPQFAASESQRIDSLPQPL